MCCDLETTEKEKIIVHKLISQEVAWIYHWSSWDVKTGQNSGKEICKQSNPHLVIIFDGLMLFAQFSWGPQGRGIKLWPFWILPYCRSPSWKDLRPWVATRSCTYKWFTAVSKCTTIIPPGIHLEQKASLGNFRHHAENQELTGNRFCITSPETVSLRR